MSKYIVKNCPALRWDRKKFKVCYEGNKETKCCDVDDCIIKQIVGLCKETLEQENDPINTLEMSFAQKILQILEIKEANE